MVLWLERVSSPLPVFMCGKLNVKTVSVITGVGLLETEVQPPRGPVAPHSLTLPSGLTECEEAPALSSGLSHTPLTPQP